MLHLQQSGIPPRDCTLEHLPEREWSRSWMEDLHPMRFGRRLWICPSWHEPPDGDAVTITLDPGLAFGTGTHPTTAMCLEWLDSHPPEKQRVLDYGCGSGILAIAAARLGAGSVTAIDNDPQALLACRDNARKNGISRHIGCHAPEQAPSGQYHLLLANILANPLIQLAPRLARLVQTDGKLLLSGILEEQAEEVGSAYAPWFRIGPVRQREGWVLLEGERR
ncbi:MAG TPA: 50S ribosomal protein L11 methyltransferase [Thiotrichales bacterium]|nr:50S ribosomal protein L11 methyltransferase [Thiotrichales bacterium]